ncbi:MAG: hypothetical protein A4E54_01657 [Pelotomaculum sp. PtaB.Bin117]|nr:MAG: hypothetical protein A4E54_01657 [Pelotomaculum sp. PtaB.Bin117]OPY61589.1 MAG: hypothetical protein A4E56_01949 [Pelotomaculum sp. PtaU1.Bin065]
MSQVIKQTVEMPNDIYESMLKIFIKMALEKNGRSQSPIRFLKTQK